MKALLVLPFLALVALTEANEHKCQQTVQANMDFSLLPRSHLGEECGTRTRKFKTHRGSVENLMLKEIKQSYELLLMGNQFGKDSHDRPGFKKYFQSLSDEAWEHAIDLAKYINKRGSQLEHVSVEVPLHKATYVGEELSSLGAALDLQQNIIHDVGRIHEAAREPQHSDPDLAAYMERMLKEEISEVRKLAGYITNLNSMYGNEERQLAIFHFDNMLNAS